MFVYGTGEGRAIGANWPLRKGLRHLSSSRMARIVDRLQLDREHHLANFLGCRVGRVAFLT